MSEMSTQAVPPVERHLPLADYYDLNDSDNVCFLCGNPRFAPYVHNEHYGVPVTFQRCACGLVKQTPMPNEAFFAWFFNSESFFRAQQNEGESIWGYQDYFSDEPSRMATSRYRYWRLRKVFGKTAGLNVLKIGPATGTFLHVAQERGHNAIGCDISNEFIAYAKQHYGVHIDEGRFEDQGYAASSFDVVLLLSVLENLPKPVEFFQEVGRVLKPNGRFILNYVAMDLNVIEKMQREKYALYRPPVTYAYTTDVLSQTLGHAGLEIESRFRDLRIMTLEKILSLGGWRRAWSIARALRVHRVPLPVYAYPSFVAVVKPRA